MSHQEKLSSKQFIYITLITSLWINASEVFRYFVFVKPKTEAFFANKPGVAAIDLGIFSIWGLWDTLLTAVLVFVCWIYMEKFGYTRRSILASATLVWASIFVIFWVATANMGLSDWNMLGITLPLSWIEMIIGAWIIARLFKSKRWSPSYAE